MNNPLLVHALIEQIYNLLLDWGKFAHHHIHCFVKRKNSLASIVI